MLIGNENINLKPKRINGNNIRDFISKPCFHVDKGIPIQDIFSYLAHKGNYNLFQKGSITFKNKEI